MGMERRLFFRERIQQYRNDITLFFREVLCFEPDDWQKAAGACIVQASKVSIRSGQGVGKTAFEAGVLLWFLACYPFARVVATAPTKQQLHDVLWSEVAKWQSKSPLLSALLKWTKTYVYMQGYEKRWFAVARAAAHAENIQGFHSDNMLFIVDEASGVDDEIMEAVLGTLSGGNNKLLMCGNPTRTSGVFYDSHTKDRGEYKTLHVDSESTPRTNKSNIASLKRKYGEDSNVVRVRVHGEFPLQEDDVFIPVSLIEKSIMTERTDITQAETIHIGCDVARYGNDKTVIGYKVDNQAFFYKKIRGQDLMKTAKMIAQLGLKLREKYRFTGNIPIKIDDTGVGGGVVDKLKELKSENTTTYSWMIIIPVNFGIPIKHKYYHDSTTYMMSVIRDLISTTDDDGNQKDVELILPNDDDMVAQFSSRKYDYMSNGKQRIESKKAMKVRGLPSPDEADCMLLVCLPVSPKVIQRGM